jgi:hypothetical protein
MRRIVKVSYDQKKVLVRYEQDRAGDVDEFEIVCKDKPAPEFVTALAALRTHVAEICELTDNYCQDLEVRGASFSYGGEGKVMGATITALKTVSTARSPLCLNTPHLPSEPYSDREDDETPCLSDDAAEALDHLCLAALAYVDGKRAQVELFADAKV